MKRTLITCSIFEAELKHVLAGSSCEVDIKWLPAGLHCDLDMLEKSLTELLEASKSEGRGLRLLIGSGCLPQMKELAKSYEIPVLSEKNCVESLLGPERLRALEQNKTMVITPSWIRKVFLAPDGVKRFLGWDNTDFRINFGRYDRLLVLEAGLEPLSDEETLEFFEIAEVPIETEEIDLNHFKEVMNRFLA
ncbi:MAG: DUF1638 domain-containing protein [Deltaproteobacteria bacterium]|nr:DUF1638 domain-containing protein [Deltaproteobacteria bacterium]